MEWFWDRLSWQGGWIVIVLVLVLVGRLGAQSKTGNEDKVILLTPVALSGLDVQKPRGLATRGFSFVYLKRKGLVILRWQIGGPSAALA